MSIALRGEKAITLQQVNYFLWHQVVLFMVFPRDLELTKTFGER